MFKYYKSSIFNYTCKIFCKNFIKNNNFINRIITTANIKYIIFFSTGVVEQMLYRIVHKINNLPSSVACADIYMLM